MKTNECFSSEATTQPTKIQEKKNGGEQKKQHIWPVALAAGQLLSLTALIAQRSRHREKHFDVGLPDCAGNQAVIVQTWFISYPNNYSSWNNNPKHILSCPTKPQIALHPFLMRRNLFSSLRLRLDPC